MIRNHNRFRHVHDEHRNNQNESIIQTLYTKGNASTTSVRALKPSLGTDPSPPVLIKYLQNLKKKVYFCSNLFLISFGIEG